MRIIHKAMALSLLLSGLWSIHASAASVLDEINAAKNAHELSEIVHARAYELGISMESEEKEIFYSLPIYARLCADYSSTDEFKAAYEAELERERSEPAVMLTDSSGGRAYSIGRGSYRLSINHGALDEPITFAAAVYENGRLRKVAVAQSNGETTQIDLTGIKIGSGEPSFKLLSLNSIEGLMPAEEWMYISREPKPTEESDISYIYVSAAGDDSASGTPTNPVKSPARAAQLAETLAAEADSDVVIAFSGGVYEIDRPITLTASDSGIIWRGPADGSAVISGGRTVTGWSLYKNGIYKASIDAEDIRQLYVNGEPAVRARTEGTLTGISSDRYGITVKRADIPAEILAAPSGAELVFDILWNRERLLIESVSDTDNASEVKLVAATPWYAYYLNSSANRPCDTSSGSYSKSRYNYYIENALCLLDAQNEFYFDKANKTLYYKPGPGVDITSSNIIAPYSEGLLYIKGTASAPVEDISFENLSFECGTWLEPSGRSYLPNQAGQYWTEQKSIKRIMPSQIQLSYARGIEFTNTKFINMGSTAMSMEDGVSECTVRGSVFKNVEGALSIGSPDYVDAKPYSLSLMTSDITIDNNTITDTGREYSSNPAVTVYHAKNVDITHNTITDCSYSGISVGWGWLAASMANSSGGGHNISCNRIERTVTATEDGAPIYTLGRMGSAVTIEGNYINKSYDGTVQSPNALGWHGGIYCDEGSSDIAINGNVIEGVYRWLYARYNAQPRNITAEGNYCDTGSYIANDTAGIDTSTTDGVINVRVKSHNTYSLTNRPEAVTNIINASGAK